MNRYIWKFVDPRNSSQFVEGEDRYSDVRPRIGAVVQVQGTSYTIVQVDDVIGDTAPWTLHVHLGRVRVPVARIRRA